MATAALVNSDIEIGRRIVATLTRAAIPVTVYLWAFIPQLQEWQFIVATPLVDSKGPLAAYGEVNKALQREGVFDDVPLRRIFLKSPHDQVLKSLERQSKVIPQEAFRVVNAPIAGNFVEDAYVYAGSVHILRSRTSRSKSGQDYSVIYTPYKGPGGAAPAVHFGDVADLTHFLKDRLHITPNVVDAALDELEKRGNTSIPEVHLRAPELKKLGLV